MLVTKTIFPGQCRAARAFLGWSQETLSARAHVARKTIVDFEKAWIRPQPRTIRDLVAALEEAGIEFLDPIEGRCGPGVRLRLSPVAAVDDLDM